MKKVDLLHATAEPDSSRNAADSRIPMSHKTSHQIQRVEMIGQDIALHCPFCGARAYDPDDDTPPTFDTCGHVLFVAHDEGFEYRSLRFDRLMNLEGVVDEDVDPGTKGYDAFTDGVVCENAIKFACYVPAPSFYGAY
jgi:hypothetical protein